MNKRSITKIIIATIILMVSISFLSCQKDLAGSADPTVFIVVEISQSNTNNENNVAMYRLRELTTSYKNDSRKMYTNRWYTLKEGFQVGDTLEFVKK